MKNKTTSFKGTFTPQYGQTIEFKVPVITNASWTEVQFSTLSTDDLKLLKVALDKELEGRE